MFTSSLSSAFMTLCLNLMLPLHLRRSKHFPAYSLLFRLDKTLVPRTFMLPNNPQQRVNLCYYIHYNFFLHQIEPFTFTLELEDLKL